jgi:hypothetical protein
MASANMRKRNSKSQVTVLIKPIARQGDTRSGIMERRLSLLFGLLIGGMWIGEVLLGNLRDAHPRIYALAPVFALAAVGVTLFGGMVAAYRANSIPAALRVGVWSGLLSGAITLGTIFAITLLFHNAMMGDPANLREFARSAHRLPSTAELSRFLYTDALGGGLNHLWIGPFLGITVGAVGALFDKWQRQSELQASTH